MLASIVSLIVLAIAVSVDGFGVGVTYGMRRIRIPLLSVLIISCCSGFIIWMSMQIGGWMSSYFSDFVAKLIGSFILIAIGCWALIQLARDKTGESLEQQSTAAVQDHASSEKQVLKVELKRLGLVIQILRTPQAADVDKSGNISSSEAVMLGVALSLDAFGAGLGAALVGLPPLLTAVVIAVSSAMFLVGGTRIGLRFSTRSKAQIVTILPGILLIMIGIMKLL